MRLTMTAKPSLLIILFSIANLVALDAMAARDGGSWFSDGKHLYTAGEYTQAVEAFQRAVDLNPGVSEYYHWLGKAYGRLAERASWLRAVGLARKTRAAFERAVQLDETNVEALSDLEEYYLSAPGFLGGGAEKARQVRRKRITLQDG